MSELEKDLWYWHHNVSECYYHIQITVKYRKSLLDEAVQKVITEIITGLKERYTIETNEIGYDQNHMHILCRFLPTYSGGQVIKVIKSLTAKAVFQQLPYVKKSLWGGEFWTDGYYIATVGGRGTKFVIEQYIRNQGRDKDVNQLKLFTLN